MLIISPEILEEGTLDPGIGGDPNSLHSKYAQEGRWSNYPLNLSPRAQARGWGEGGPEGLKQKKN